MIWSILLLLDLSIKYYVSQKSFVVHNVGATLGLGSGVNLTYIIMLIIVFLIYEWQKQKGLAWWGMGLVITGGIGNLIDRLIYGYVRDFIHYPIIDIYGNIADIYIISGIIVLLWISKSMLFGKTRTS